MVKHKNTPRIRIINTRREAIPPTDKRTPAEIEVLCCEIVPVDPCSKVGRVEDFYGPESADRNFDPEADLAKARADNPDKRIISVRVEKVGTRKGRPCGKIRKTWGGRFSCCEFVEPIIWDFDSSVDVLAPETYGVVYIDGGSPPYLWSIRGNGFTFDGKTMRDALTYAPSITVFASAIACGFAPINVRDNCSTASHGVRSTNGKWGPDIDFYRAADCAFTGIDAVITPGSMTTIYDQTHGEFKQRITTQVKSSASISAGCLSDTYPGVYPTCQTLAGYIAGPLKSYCDTVENPPLSHDTARIWCFKNMVQDDAVDGRGCCSVATPKTPEEFTCYSTIYGRKNQWIC